MHRVDESVKGNRRKDFTLIMCMGVIPKRKRSRLIEVNPLQTMNVYNQKFIEPFRTSFPSLKFVGKTKELKKAVNEYLDNLLKQAEIHVVEEKTPKEKEQERIANKSW